MVMLPVGAFPEIPARSPSLSGTDLVEFLSATVCFGHAYTLPSGAQSLADSNVGTIHWLQPDTSAYQQDKMQWTTVQSGISSGYISGNDQPDLTVKLDGWSAKIGSNNVGTGGGILVNVDPYYSGIYMPGSQARLFRRSSWS